MGRFRRRISEESGVVLVIVAGMMVAVLGMGALAIDIGSFYKAERQAQTAADAGALAASQDLPLSAGSATGDGTTYALRNYPGAVANVTTNYNGDSTRVKVTVSAITPSFFGQIFGLTNANVSASAVAGGDGSASPAAIFGHDDLCGDVGVALNGNTQTINGAVISNGNLSEATNSNSTIGTATYGGDHSCLFTNNSSNGVGASFNYGPSFTPNVAPFPTDWRTSPPTCTASPQSPATTFVWSKSNQTIPAGVYCADEIDITGNNLSNDPAGVTFIANRFVITGNNMTLTAPSPTSLLFWDQGTGTFEIGKNGNSMAISGEIFAPTATIDFHANATGSGFVQGQNVIIDGNSFAITGTGPVLGNTLNSLVQ